jgi:hypothetical protein
MTEKQKWFYLWHHILDRTMLSEPAAKLAASLAIEWLKKHESK